ncbi:MAG: phenylpropionate dioxygenase-like ring-hydroxylating dioxygenase large terminal subunit [Halioglobus sp.]|jgi:phenylpropionate dioxygenase-like ring-hydroxylating dioxygenase large terminal subunit
MSATDKNEDKKYFTPSIDGDTPLPSLGEERIDTERFSSPEFMDLEWQQLWRKVWNIGPRIEELVEPGDYVTHTLGKESFLFSLDKENQIHGFYNVCQHRGNQLVPDSYCGSKKFFQCPFHAWSYNLDGSLKGVPGSEHFPQFRDGIPKDEMGLEPIEVDFWGGFICFKLDKGGPSLMEFLGDLPEQVAPYRLEDMRLLEYKTFLWDSNWKVACDAFNESYHFRGLHPQMLKWSDEVARIELIGEHSRMINKYGTTSSPFTGGPEVYPELKEWMMYNGMDPEAYEGAPEDVWKAKVEFTRSVQDAPGVTAPYHDMTDEQLTDVYHYFIFPGFAMNVFPEGINGFRYRPHETDPTKMYYDLIMLVHYPEGTQIPCERKFFNEKVRYDEIADTPMSYIVTDVLQQDADNVSINQKGITSDGFRGMYLGDQELRLRHFHNCLDNYLADK